MKCSILKGAHLCSGKFSCPGSARALARWRRRVCSPAGNRCSTPVSSNDIRKRALQNKKGRQRSAHMNFTSSEASLQPRSRRFSLVAALCLILGATFLAPSAWAGGYCAIAFSKSTGRTGSGYSYGTRAGAQNRALLECGARDAFVAMWGYDTYIALATGQGGAWGTGRATRQRAAERQALRNCPAADARVVRVVHSFN